eukprot:5435426-Alexandrium_andersonii.AAC.1
MQHCVPQAASIQMAHENAAISQGLQSASQNATVTQNAKPQRRTQFRGRSWARALQVPNA